jgi:hypothetical protein
VFGEIQGEIDLSTTSLAELGMESLSVVLTKTQTDDWCFFLTEDGFAQALHAGPLVEKPRAVWIASEFEGFSTTTLTIAPWNEPKRHDPPAEPPERPRKLVRDLTHRLTPSDVGPWLLRTPMPRVSPVFDAWRRVAVERLVFAIPSEVRLVEAREWIVLKGPRSAPIEYSAPPKNWENEIFPLISEAAHWIYATSREAETKFQFLNNHLSLDWREKATWPEGLVQVLAGSLASAREAFAFYLQDQSKDALKSLGELRKALQDEVARAHTATRDLISSLWRDLAIAGVVLALKSPTASQIASAEVLRWVTLGTAFLLLISLIVTIGSSWRFNSLADSSRREWRKKLYAFLSEQEWQRLVENPIQKGRRVYYLALPFVVGLYLAAIFYLLLIAEPVFAGAYIVQPLLRFSRLLGHAIARVWDLFA